MDSPSLKVSVIIPTYNGAHRIYRTLKALMHQSVTPDEVVVVIDGSKDNTEHVVKEFSAHFKSLKTISQTNMGRAGVRNTGVKNATGDLLIFYDDDTRPESDSIQKHLAFHLSHNKAILSGFPLEDIRLMKTDIQKYKEHLSRNWTSKYPNGLNQLTKDDIFLTAANLSVKKQDYAKIGGFNEALTDTEDYDFALRAMDKNFQVFFDKTNIAWHDDFITCKLYINRRKQYNKALQQYRTKSSSESRYFVRLIRFFFSRPFWHYLVDHSKILLLLPRKLRYRLYTLIIWSSAKK